MTAYNHESDISDAELLHSLPEDPLQASELFVAHYGNEKRLHIDYAKRRVYIYSFVSGKDKGILNLQNVTFGQLARAKELFSNNPSGLLEHLALIGRNHFTIYGTPEFREDICNYLSLPMQVRGEDKDVAEALYELDTDYTITSSITLSENRESKLKEKKESGSKTASKSPQMTYEQRRQMLFSKVSGIVEGFRQNPDDIAEYLSFARRFNRYSHKNLRIIFAQDRHASFVESASFFKNGMPSNDKKPLTDKKIFIKKGEKALYIWAPREIRYVMHPAFNKFVAERLLSDGDKVRAASENWKSTLRTEFFLVPVFDISQTDAPPELYPKIFGFVGEHTPECDTAYRALCDYLSSELNCTVEICDIGSMKTSVRGYYSREENAIKLSDMLSGEELLSTAIHEAAHAELHSIQTDRSTCQKELEADMYALMLQEKLGISITESRKAHLSEHYNAYVEELQKNLPSRQALDISSDCPAFNNAISRYQKQSPIIDRYLAKQLSQSAELNGKPADVLSQAQNTYQTAIAKKRSL